MLASLLNLRNAAIVIGLCLTAFAVQSLRIKWLKSSKHELQIENARLIGEIDKTVQANESNQETIAEILAANQLCAHTRKVSEANSKAQAQLHQGRMADITTKYEKLRKTKTQSVCASTDIDDEFIRLRQ